MTRRLVILWLMIAVAVGIGLLTSASCKSYPDDKECRGDKVNALDAEAATECTTCMQEHCCDVLGACADLPAKDCADPFKEAQGCVFEAGAGNEPMCKVPLAKSAPAQALYKCVRGEQCGAKCGVPSCNLNTAVTLFGTATCDRCVVNSCCDQINHCYENRQCKLFLQCITDHCPNTLGPTLSVTAKFSKDDLEATRKTVCAGGPPPEPVRAARCLSRCFNEFTGPTTPDGQEAECLAYGVYTCAAGAGCGDKCTLVGGLDGGPVTEGAYPEDLP